MSLLDRNKLLSLCKEIRPERVIHLASYSSVAYSWEHPVECFLNNTNIFLNLVETLRELAIACRILSVGSSEGYGQVSSGEIPLYENKCPNPINPYAVARVSQENISKVYSLGYGLPIICTRSFNHIGPDQPDAYVVSSFVRQAVEVSLGRRKVISCGKLEIVRDFIDVRDVVRAYHIILEKGNAGEVYNVCSGRGTLLEELLLMICRLTGINPAWIEEKSLIRPTENPIIVGDLSKLTKLGFVPLFILEDSLKDLLSRWQKELIKSSM